MDGRYRVPGSVIDRCNLSIADNLYRLGGESPGQLPIRERFGRICMHCQMDHSCNLAIVHSLPKLRQHVKKEEDLPVSYLDTHPTFSREVECSTKQTFEDCCRLGTVLDPVTSTLKIILQNGWWRSTDGARLLEECHGQHAQRGAELETRLQRLVLRVDGM